MVGAHFDDGELCVFVYGKDSKGDTDMVIEITPGGIS